jgi:DNA-binding transcriptional MerR regulator
VKRFILTRVTPKLYKAGEVCELLQVQPYVLRSWEKEFPGIGVQGKSPDSPRLYRQSDVEHVQRIKQLVFGEGLTVSGARRRLEASAPAISVVSESEAAEVLDALGADVKARIAVVRDGLRELQSLLSDTPGSSNGHPARRAAKRSTAKRTAAPSRTKTVKRAAVRKAAAPATRKKTATKRRRA